MNDAIDASDSQRAARQLRQRLLDRWGHLNQISEDKSSGIAPIEPFYGGHDHDTVDGVDWDMDDTDVSET